MELIDMKSVPEAKPEQSIMAEPSKEVYPYGLRIHLDTESVKKLGIVDLPDIGAKVKIEAMCEVTDLRQEKSIYGEEKCIGLQIVALGLGSSEKAKE